MKASWLVLLVVLPGLACARELLSAQQLMLGEVSATPLSMAAYARPPDAVLAKQHFEGRLHIAAADREFDSRVWVDHYGIASNENYQFNRLPEISIELVQLGDRLVPVRRGQQDASHPQWDILFEPGYLWQEPGDGDFTRVVLPFSLLERNANCTHNGLLSFLFKEDGSVTPVALQVSSETCTYFQFDLWGVASASYTPTSVLQAPAAVADFQRELKARLPVEPIEQLVQRLPGVEVERFANPSLIPRQQMTNYGLVLDGVHYRGACETRAGIHPYCDEISLPSYSTAKSLFAAMALMRLEKIYPGAAVAKVADYVHPCSSQERWGQVQLVHALDMVTGNFASNEFEQDENSTSMLEGFFLPESHAAKIDFSCNGWPHRAAPGNSWVYHTSDTYLLATAMNSYLRRQGDPAADIFDEVVLPLWLELGVSRSALQVRRSLDSVAQAWGGFGLSFKPGDIALLASALVQGHFDSLLDTELLDAALQRGDAPSGYPAVAGLYYSHGFWAQDLAPILDCPQPLWIPLMSGHGGIRVALLPGDTVFYYFSDSGVFDWTEPLQELHRVYPLCPVNAFQTEEIL